MTLDLLTPDRFHSLPNRKKKAATKPVGRSSSDVSSKSKTKKPSIFSLFTKKAANGNADQAVHPAHTQDTQWKRVTRSRSDVGTGTNTSRRDSSGGAIRKRNNSEIDESLISRKKSVPLSPIIESPSRLSYFDLSVDGEVPSGNIGFTNQTDLDLVPSKPTTGIGGGEAANGMHSSQQPVDRLPLTKGVTVDGIVKNLSMERFSPVPHLQGSAFSYTRPNGNTNYNNNNETKIVYAHVVPDVQVSNLANVQGDTLFEDIPLSVE